MAQHASDLINDLSSVPNIIGGLGLSIASAQKAFDVEYLDSIERILAMSKAILGVNIIGPDGKPFPEALAFLQNMIAKLAPSRYQYTETTLNVRLDLAQSMKFAGSVGLGFGIGAVSINAAFTLGYSYDYRAAAECKTVIHAYPSDPTVFNALLTRASSLNDKSLELPPRSQVDQILYDKNAAILEKMTGQKAKEIITKPVITAIDPSSPKTNTSATVPVTVTATGFLPTATVTFYNSAGVKTDKLPISSVTATGFKFSLAAGVAIGDSSIEVVNPPDTTSDKFPFKILAA